jgi:predicted type IV restriction endonuclease
MDFIDEVRALAARVTSARDMVQTEEATKNAMVMPFIHLLGYNVFDPTEVTPELIADVGTKKGEKVDYAILRDGKPIMLFECKKCGGDLSINHASQLFRYFHVTEARFGVLTNGLTYRFFTDLEQPNKMDEKPFFEFNFSDFRDQDVEELKKFAKTAFDLENILTTANHLKYTRAIKNTLNEWMAQPPEDFVRLVSAELLGGKHFKSAVKDQFTQITKHAFQQLLADRINERLKGAMTPEPALLTSVQHIEADTPAGEGSEPTDIELEAYQILRAILRAVVPISRIAIRGAATYCAILFDDNNRKPICRLRFKNENRLIIGVFDEKKEEDRVHLETLDDIFNLADRLKACVLWYTRNEETAAP